MWNSRKEQPDASMAFLISFQTSSCGHSGPVQAKLIKWDMFGRMDVNSTNDCHPSSTSAVASDPTPVASRNCRGISSEIYCGEHTGSHISWSRLIRRAREGRSAINCQISFRYGLQVILQKSICLGMIDLQNARDVNARDKRSFESSMLRIMASKSSAGCVVNEACGITAWKIESTLHPNPCNRRLPLLTPVTGRLI